jgi:hypothetical protein
MSADGSTVAIGATHNDGAGCTWIQGDGQGGSELNIGTATSNVACYAMVLAQQPTANGATVSTDGAYTCYAEFGMSSNNDNSLFNTCQFNAGSDAGHVYVFTWSGISWAQQGADLDGEAAGDWVGWSVAMSADGSTDPLATFFSITDASTSTRKPVTTSTADLAWFKAQSHSKLSCMADGSVMNLVTDAMAIDGRNTEYNIVAVHMLSICAPVQQLSAVNKDGSIASSIPTELSPIRGLLFPFLFLGRMVAALVSLTSMSLGTPLATVAIPVTLTPIPIRAHYLPRRLSACTEGEVSTLAGSGSAAFADGTGTSASFNAPEGVAFSPDGATIAVADAFNHMIRLVAAWTRAVSTLAGSGSATYADGTGTSASFNRPARLAFSPDGATLVVADSANNRIRLVVVATGAVSTLAGSGSGTYADGTGTSASFSQPMGVAWSPDGSKVVVVEHNNHRVRLIAVATQVVTTLAGSGSGTYADGTGTAASFRYPQGGDWSPDGSKSS